MNRVALIIVIALVASAARAEPLQLTAAASLYADVNGEALRAPEGVACSRNGYIVVADSGNGRLVTWQFKDGAFVGGSVIRFPELGYPARVQIDSRGNVLSLDERTRRIVRVSEQGKFAGFISPKGAPAGQGYFPVSFKLDAADALYILDASSGRIVVLDASGAFLRELQQPAGARFTDLAVDGKGAVYAVDALRGQLWKAPPGATVLDKLGAPLKDYMSFAGSLVVLDSGALLVVDSHGMGLVVAAPDGAFLGRQLGIGWTDGLVYYPGQVCAVGNELLVADSGNNRVQAFTSSR